MSSERSYGESWTWRRKNPSFFRKAEGPTGEDETRFDYVKLFRLVKILEILVLCRTVQKI
jgi:hypothetical protein